MASDANGEAGPGPSSASSGMLSPRASADIARPASRGSNASGAESVEAELARVRAEKDHLSHQYRTLLGKLTAMRNTLGEKLKEDAEELDRREGVISTLTGENETLAASVETLRAELESASAESKDLSAQLAQLRSQSDNSSSDVLSLTREMRELRGEMERLRAEREEWEEEAERERERREAMEDEVRGAERREREGRSVAERAEAELAAERERAANLQDVLSEFQEAKDSELQQATAELEGQLKHAAAQLSEYKLRAANAESSLSSLSSDATRVRALEKEIRDKNATIAKLRHDAVVTNEHLTEALRRLRKNTSDNNVDRRLVTNVLLSFLTTARADSKRFEMLSLLSTILSWDDGERERAGLQRGAGGKRAAAARRKSSAPRTAEEDAAQAAMNESFSNLFVEFLLKEASQGESREHQQREVASPTAGPFSPTGSSGGMTPRSSSVTGTPRGGRTMSSGSLASEKSVRKPSIGLQEAMGRP